METRQKEFIAIMPGRIQALLKSPWVPYVFPFILFMVITEAAGVFPDKAHILYIIKTILVGLMLWYWRKVYASDFALKLNPSGYLIAVGSGLIVLAVWICFENILPQQGVDVVFNPYSFSCPPAAVWALISVRLIGAAVVVPIMEELFWRSFLLRYLINPDFKRVAIGTFGWFSFAAVVVLFGVEHHRLIQGMLAGIIYTALVILQKSLGGCIIAHGVTNLGLGIYVITTQSWEFW
jgi:hypothetical protein